MMLGTITAFPASLAAIRDPAERTLGIIALILTILGPGLFVAWNIWTQ